MTTVKDVLANARTATTTGKDDNVGKDGNSKDDGDDSKDDWRGR